ncbi:MAG: hypothetical protein JWM59_4908 [Verrucomicrobiales bacterium]|nr:hypothetical protein [Verrucomicrobiales bacterium]
MFEKRLRTSSMLKQSGIIEVSVAAGWLLGRNPGKPQGADSPAGPFRGVTVEQAGLAASNASAKSIGAAGKPPGAGNRVTKARNALVLASVSRRQRAFSAFLESMTAEEAPQIERLFTRMDRSAATFQDDHTFEAFMERWGELDAQGAMRWLEENRGPTANPGEMEWYRNRIFTGWAASEPEKALKWADEKGDPEVSRDVFKGAIAALAQKDPVRAWRLTLERCPDDPQRASEVMNTLAESAVRAGGTEGMEQWFQTMTVVKGDGNKDGAMRVLATDAVAARMTHASHEKGVEWIAA